MKRILSLSVLALFLVFTACQNDGPITGPETPTAKVAKTSVKWLGLPQAADASLQKNFHAANHITKAQGGELNIDETYVSVDGNTVHTVSNISFAPHTVKVDCDVTMDIDDATGVSSFLPHQIFDQPAILNQTFTGLNLTGMNANNIKLYYLNTDGTFEVMENDALIVDIATGTITVVNGKIPHFSLYGYGE